MRTSEKQREKMRQYFQDNKQKYAHYTARYRDKIKAEMVVAYGGKCKFCEESDPVALCLDHIDDDAHVEIDLYGQNRRGGHKHYERLKREGWPQERFQLLCYNCNAKKEHQRRRAGIYERWGEKEDIDPSAAHANVPPPAHNKSGIKGVFWNTQKQRWQAKVSYKSKGIHLGFFEDIRDAAHAYAAKAKELWGDMARVATEEEIDKAIAEINAPKVINALASDLGL